MDYHQRMEVQQQLDVLYTYPTSHNFSAAKVSELQELDSYGQMERTLTNAHLSLNSMNQGQVSLFEMHLNLMKNGTKFVDENKEEWERVSKKMQ